MKKYFQFSGTINGLNYFLRNTLSYFLSFIMGYGIGYGIGTGNTGLTALSVILVAPVVIFSFATIWKRMNALWSNNATNYTSIMVISQIVLQFLQPGLFQSFLTLGLFVVGLILIFKDSNIEVHNG